MKTLVSTAMSMTARRPSTAVAILCLSFASVLLGSENDGLLPVSFEPNRGQADPSARFLARGPGYTLFLTANESVLLLRPAAPRADRSSIAHVRLKSTAGTGGAGPDIIRTKLIGALPNPEISAAMELPGKSNYFIGKDPALWRTEIPTYAQIRYSNIYPGVDLIYHGDQRQLEYDFVVAAGTDPGVIQLAYEGIEALSTDAAGDLMLRTSSGFVRQHAPSLYQVVDGERIAVGGRYILTGDRQIRFHVDSYDARHPLIIDPILSYASFLGGTGTDVGTAIGLDGDGNVYIGGTTSSVDLPISSTAFQKSRRSTLDGFVMKVNSSGTGLLYATYLGGSDDDFITGIAVDRSGNAYVTGFTISINFPTTPGAFQTSTPDTCCQDGFVTKLNATGSSLVYSTYLAGANHDGPDAIVVDSSGNAYVSGFTQSLSFPGINGLQTTNKGGIDAFVARFNAAGSAVDYFSFIGGSGTDEAVGITLDGGGNIYVAGVTSSQDFPVTSGAIQRTNGGGKDAFVAKFSSSLTLTYSTLLGGSGDDAAWQVSVPASGSIYVAGRTGSTNFPVTTNALQPTNKGGANDVFLAKIAPGGSSLLVSTYLGGKGDDRAFAMAVDAAENVYLAGRSDSTDFPVTRDAIQATLAGAYDIFVAKLGSSATTLQYATYLGGADVDDAFAIALDSQGRLYLTGQTASANFPATGGGLQTHLGGPLDAILVRLDVPSGGSPVSVPSTMSLISGNNQSGVAGAVLSNPLVVQVKDIAGNPSADVAVNFTATNATINPVSTRTDASGRASTNVTLGSSVGPATVTAGVTGLTSVTFNETVTAPQAPGQQAWQTSWDEFLKAYQACLNVSTCDVNQFSSKTIMWQGTFSGTGMDTSGFYASTTMTAGKMTDRGNHVVDVLNVLIHRPLDQAPWRALTQGAVVKFQSQTSSFYGFLPLASACCFYVGLSGDSRLITGPVPPSAISIVSGNNQSGVAGAVLSNPVVVQVKDSGGNPTADVAVNFTATNATVNPASTRTDASGRASTTVTLGPSLGTATIAAGVAGLTAVNFNETVTAPQVPLPSITDVVDGGAFLPNIAQAGWLTIRGANLASTTRVWAASDFVGDVMPTSLDGVSVGINGKTAAIYYVSPVQLNVLAPLLNITGPVTVTVTTRQGTASKTATVQSVVPSFFMLDPENRKYVAAVNLDGTLVGKPALFPSNPTATKPLVGRGRASIYGTGWGLSDPVQPDGLAFSDARPLVNGSSVGISIGGVQATVEFAGAVGPGLYQFNIIAPDLAAGDYPILGEISGVKTQPGAFITLAAAPPPLITSVTPSSGQAGQTINTLSIAGQNLASVNSLGFSPSTGLNVSITSVTDTAIIARLDIASSAASGQRSLTVSNGTRTSNSLSFAITPAPPPPPVITSIDPASGETAQTITVFNVLGTNLGGTPSLQFTPSDGITATVTSSTSNMVRGVVEIANDAPVGERLVLLIYPSGQTNALPFTVRARSGNFLISNMRAGPATNSIGQFGRQLNLPITVNFNDPSGAATSGPNNAVTFFIDIPGLFTVSSSFTPSGITPGQTQGTMQFNFIFIGAQGTVGKSYPFKFSLINSQQNRSNRLEGSFVVQ